MAADLLSALRALLREVRESTPHSFRCLRANKSWTSHDERCDWQARVDAEIARRWVASILAVDEAWENIAGDPAEDGMLGTLAMTDAALRAARSTPEEIKP